MNVGDLVFCINRNKPSIVLATGSKNPRTGIKSYRDDIVWAYWEEYNTYGYMPINEVKVLERKVFTDEEYQEIFV